MIRPSPSPSSATRSGPSTGSSSRSRSRTRPRTSSSRTRSRRARKVRKAGRARRAARARTAMSSNPRNRIPTTNSSSPAHPPRPENRGSPKRMVGITPTGSSINRRKTASLSSASPTAPLWKSNYLFRMLPRSAIRSCKGPSISKQPRSPCRGAPLCPTKSSKSTASHVAPRVSDHGKSPFSYGYRYCGRNQPAALNLNIGLLPPLQKSSHDL